MSTHSIAHTTPSRARQAQHGAAVMAGGKLPSYCERKPAAVLDDGWTGEVIETVEMLEAADLALDDADIAALEADSLGDDFDMETYDDFYDDSGDLEDSR